MKQIIVKFSLQSLKIRVYATIKTFIKSIEITILDRLLLSAGSATEMDTLEGSLDEPNELDDDSTNEISTTIVIPSESITDESPAEHVYWKIISITFIATTIFLIIISVCLWRTLPSSLKPILPQPKSN